MSLHPRRPDPEPGLLSMLVVVPLVCCFIPGVLALIAGITVRGMYRDLRERFRRNP